MDNKNSIEKKVFTKGNIIVNDINVGDIHYEYDYGVCMKLKVITKPNRSNDGQWAWKSEIISSGKELNYLVKEGLEHYSANLYDYEAYNVKVMI